mmetsp:Transcript_39081/g.97462  ORF Transcript_39081/g.97462 Transcript_39081/m.97462 type:complete len:493 (-) Transcript_39081:356-1834(-)
MQYGAKRRHITSYLDKQHRHQPVPVGDMHQAQICIRSLTAPGSAKETSSGVGPRKHTRLTQEGTAPERQSASSYVRQATALPSDTIQGTAPATSAAAAQHALASATLALSQMGRSRALASAADALGSAQLLRHTAVLQHTAAASSGSGPQLALLAAASSTSDPQLALPAAASSASGPQLAPHVPFAVSTASGPQLAQVLAPACECQTPAVWCLRRWVCRNHPCCGFEHEIPEAPYTPLCHCGLRASWGGISERFWCGSGKPPRLGGCGFEAWPRQWAEPQRPLRRSEAEIDIAFAHEQAALLTAAAYGCLSAHCFVAPSEHGLGLWSRAPLRRGQAIVEYSGPRMPLSRLKIHTYALEVPDGQDLFIDGNYDNSNTDGVRSVAIFANHSRHPNCVLQHWPCKTGPDQMWIVAKEDIAAGRELRYDYEQGGSIYWQGQPPRESNWRSGTVRTPPPSGIEPTIDFLPQLLSRNGPSAPWPSEVPRGDKYKRKYK